MTETNNIKGKIYNYVTFYEYQPSSAEGTRSLPATPAKSKIATRGPKLAEGVWKGVAHGFGLNKFFDLSTLSMKN